MKKYHLPLLLFTSLFLLSGCALRAALPPAPAPDLPPAPMAGGEKEQGLSEDDPAASHLSPPIEKEPLKEIEGLVRLSDLGAGFIFDLKYATADNFVGKAVYPVAVAVLKKETANRLLEANKTFQADGYRIKIWDAYRPLSVQRILWETYPDLRYVSNPDPLPPVGGWKARHYNGMSVDMTLVDAWGNELEMPTGFDNFTEKAAPDYPGMTVQARANLDYLEAVMETAGFKSSSTEWWHFNDLAGSPGPYLDIPLEAFLD